MHIKENNSWIKHLDFIALNLLALVAAFVCAYMYKFDTFYFYQYSSWRAVLLILIMINLVVTFIMNPYSGIFRRPYYEDVIKLFMLTVYSAVIVFVLFYLVKIGATYSRVTMVLTFILYFILSVIFLYIRKRLLLSGKVQTFANRKRRMLLVAELEGIRETMENIYASDIEEYEIVGFCFPKDEYRDGEFDGAPVVNSRGIADYVVTEHIDDVFVNVNPGLLATESYRQLVDNEVTVHLSFEAMTGIEGDDQFVTGIGVFKAASIGPYAFDARKMMYLTVKRIVDILFALIGCLFLLPLMAVVKLSNVLSGDHAPIFYYQTRVGQFGKTFRLSKFRSMVPNADEILQEMLKEEHYRKEWEANQKFNKDPRITRIGRILRKTSLDEFPQFINVLKGDMSIVGPRPLIVGELDDHNGRTLYNRVKPGITGWWGCNGRSNINYRERLELEYYYVKNCSLYLDALCIVRTVLAVFKRDGAQ